MTAGTKSWPGPNHADRRDLPWNPFGEFCPDPVEVPRLRGGFGGLRAEGADDVVVVATAEGTSVSLAKPKGPATIESDAATRCLFLWGRGPGDPSRWRSPAGPETLRRVR